MSTIMGGMPLAGSQERPDELEMPTLGSGFYPAVSGETGECCK